MRITGGIIVRRQFEVPEKGIRPTQDRVREALFSSLCARMPDARVLDLFAGSGAMGLEAWSRGAAHVTWVEGDRSVFRILERNVQSLCADEGGDVSVIISDVWAYLEKCRARKPYDIIIADPPYDPQRQLGQLEKLLKVIKRQSILAPDGCFVFEQSAKEEAIESEGWCLTRNKKYGHTRLLMYC